MKKLTLAITFLVMFTSCGKLLISDDPANDPITNFEHMWNTINERYSFLETKNIDWDSIYHVYRAKVHEDMGPVELFDVLADMLYELRDGHVNLVSPFDVSRNWEWYLNSPPNFNYDLLERNYLEPNYRIVGPFRVTVIDSVGYMYYGSFSSAVSHGNMNFILEQFKELKGVVIDIRNNGGGSLANVQTIASRFTDSRRLYGYEKYKSGPGRHDFTEPFPKYIEPEGELQFTGKVVVLSNRKSYSAANDFIMVMKSFPNVVTMGDTTGGGGGLPISRELPNGWRYRFSSTITLDHEMKDVEPGIAPDRVVYLKPEDFERGIDTILEEALEEARR